MADNTLPLQLGHKCLALVESTHRTASPRELPGKMCTKRNAIAIAMLPEALVIARAASAAFKVRVFLWLLAAVLLGLSPLLAWWLALLGATVIVAERLVAARERKFWILLAAMLLTAEVLAEDFAGWGTAYPMARQLALGALGPGDGNMEWLDCYLPRRAELGADLVRAFGPKA